MHVCCGHLLLLLLPLAPMQWVSRPQLTTPCTSWQRQQCSQPWFPASLLLLVLGSMALLPAGHFSGDSITHSLHRQGMTQRLGGSKPEQPELP
jgi:hypothetical protein